MIWTEEVPSQHNIITSSTILSSFREAFAFCSSKVYLTTSSIDEPIISFFNNTILKEIKNNFFKLHHLHMAMTQITTPKYVRFKYLQQIKVPRFEVSKILLEFKVFGI